MPTALGLPPRIPRARPWPSIRNRRSHAFLSNVETFARMALASRGDTRHSALITLSGCVAQAGVLEVDPNTPVRAAVRVAGVAGDPTLAISGGWHGAWTSWDAISDQQLNRAAIEAAGGRWGAGAFVLIGPDVEPLTVLARVAESLAAASAGRCGPCTLGLPALARLLSQARTSQHEQAGGPAAVNPTSHLTGELEQLLVDVTDRGLCAHPTATAAAVRSALSAIAASATPRELTASINKSGV